jgi:gliding motility-associated-like protein
MKRLACFIVTNLILLSAWSQTSLFYNNGASVYLMPGSYMIVNNDSLHNYLGTIQNGGDLRVAGDIYNDTTAILSGSPTSATGLYDIGGNWVNSGIVTSYQDSVMMNGDARGSSGASGAQLITGRHVTAFHDLILAGTANSVKTQTLNATVDGILDLRTDELATQQNEMLVLNTSPAAITKTNLNSSDGYVSSTGVGMLARATNSTSAYLYPVGIPSAIVSATTPFYYRPLDITPTGTGADIYGARLVDNPDSDSYFVSKYDDTLCSVNPHFYHRLYHNQGSDAAAIAMYFDPTTDGYWTDMAHWGLPHTAEWNYMGTPTTGSGYGFSSVEIPNWSHFTPDPFALAAKKFYVNAGPDQNIYPNQSVTLNAAISTPNISSIVWTPDTFINNNTISDPTVAPDQNVAYVITVTDKAGCSISDTVNVFLLPDLLLIPTAFSPNNDGVNDLFKPLNKNLNKIDFQVYDRWGQKIYETDVIGDGWDGTYKGRKQDLGVYVWQAEYQLTGQTKTLSASGNVTLVR